MSQGKLKEKVGGRAQEFSTVFADTLKIQMYELVMAPGDSVGLHQYPDHTHCLCFVWGKLMLWMDGTQTVEMELNTGDGFLGEPMKDAAKNIGDATIRMITTEIHRAR